MKYGKFAGADYNRLPEETERDFNCKFAEFDDIIEKSDLISIHLPLSDKTEGMFGKEVLGRMKKGSWLVNVSRGAICDRDSIAKALEDGQLGGYAGRLPPCVMLHVQAWLARLQLRLNPKYCLIFRGYPWITCNWRSKYDEAQAIVLRSYEVMMRLMDVHPGAAVHLPLCFVECLYWPRTF